jgi:hypothetical protein
MFARHSGHAPDHGQPRSPRGADRCPVPMSKLSADVLVWMTKLALLCGVLAIVVAALSKLDQVAGIHATDPQNARLQAASTHLFVYPATSVPAGGSRLFE